MFTSPPPKDDLPHAIVDFENLGLNDILEREEERGEKKREEREESGRRERRRKEKKRKRRE